MFQVHSMSHEIKMFKMFIPWRNTGLINMTLIGLYQKIHNWTIKTAHPLIECT